MLHGRRELGAWLAIVAISLAPACAGEEELSYDAFDQRPGEGWRKPADAGKHLEAAAMIDAYCERHPALKDWQLANLRFHAGQLYAFEGKQATALARFKRAVLAEEPAESPVRWNAYVRATIAFLEGDRPKLVELRDVIAKGPKLDGKAPNLDVVDGLIEHFGESYRAAYGGRK